MRDEQHQFLTLLGQLPARLTAEQAAWVLNCQVHDLPALVAAKLLKPLGNPPANGIKFFATVDVLEHVRDRNWLVRVTSTINQHWQKKNAPPERTHGERADVAGGGSLTKNILLSARRKVARQRSGQRERVTSPDI
jgi:hypothetical protein